MRKYVAALAAVAAMIAALITPASGDIDVVEPENPEWASGRYVVVMDEEPLVTQFGQENVDSGTARNRDREMRADHRRARQAAGVSESEVVHDYTVSLNGFAAELNDSQVQKMKDTDGVFMVLPDTIRYLQTDSSPDFLGLTGRRGAYRSGIDGEGVVVGVIDSGIWPEHPSFADDGTYPAHNLDLDGDVYPVCDFGNTDHRPDDLPFTCNNKLIGARQILNTYRFVIGADATEFDSARDDDGHGTHTASTSAGNAGVEAEIFGKDYGEISGIAPRASIIAYKALGNQGGFTSDLAAAIDQAVADGVDVINYSVGGGAGGVSADEIAFLFAADAGVRVATSAGNDGPDPGTLGDPATKPWLTSVGASTQTRFFEGTLKLGNGRRYTGASVTGTVKRSPLVDAEFAGGDLCVPGTLDPAVVEGSIVLCRRGAIARAAKSQAVLEAGGVGMILYENTDDNNLLTDSHWVPTVHVDNTPGLKIKQYIERSRKPQASITSTGKVTKWRRAPTMAHFSSRGPNPVAGDIIKPDVTAPGVQILAGYSPVTTGTPSGELFAAIQGTSMSSPHVAGLFALLADVHPEWSAAATRSALMTTADTRVRDNDRRSQASVFAMGAGHVDPGQPKRKGSMFDPGLVYDAGFLDYLGFLCDAFPETLANPAEFCPTLEEAGIPTDASDLNYPSIAVAELAGTQVVTRTVTNVSDSKRPLFFRASVKAPKGYEVEVSPKRLRIGSGESASYQVRITNISAPVGEWREGSLTWRGSGYDVRSPIAVRGVSYAAASEVSGSGTDGSASFPITFGYSGEYSAAAHGLESSTVLSGNVLQDVGQIFDPSDVGAGAVVHEITTNGTAMLRLAMPPDATEPDADIDIYVHDSAGNQVAASTAGGTDELIDLVLPADDTYSVYVHGWSAPGGDSDYLLYTWLISATPGGNMTVTDAPASAVSGQTSDVSVSWTGATAGEWHLGAVSHSDGSGLMGLTLVNVDNR